MSPVRLVLAALLLAPAAALAPAGCGENVTLGCEPPPPQCQGQSCGAPCSVDPCADRCEPGCGVLGSCDDTGTCSTAAPHCMPKPPGPCAGLACGAKCEACDPMSDGGCPPPPMMLACDPMGKCVPGPPSCP